ncbi:MAG: hypothetical protein E4H33_01870 [Anaerolineales bacterium]|nr:MAG: hypothetical protein E4H33_01870 [Anaerolineales bacterium]
MLIYNVFLVILGAVILVVGLIYVFRIVAILRSFGLARPWIILSVLISFFFLGFVFIGLRFLKIDLVPAVTQDGLVTAIFFFGAVSVLTLAILNRNLFVDILGKGIDDA